ncbi:phospholipid-binding protein MlaC [Actinobacillus porcinus]|uniref:phospholipid-binding protein MlaC n=1 Tax=Actinobacillus porcinus TaxID=51048 RepID=UPI002354933C|nr:phospholipid-binding protein MlaC [Actinobacillus porcinus]
MTMQFKTWFSKMLVLVTALFAVQTVMAVDSPYELTKQASDKLFSDLKADQTKIKADPNHLRSIVRNDLMPYVHVNYAGSLVLGPYFKSTTPEQREKFFAAFEKYIEQAYAQALTLYANQDIQVQKEQVEGNQASVLVKLLPTSGNEALNISLLWRKNSKTGKWQVYDMIAADGLSMVDSKKVEWSGILRKDGIDALTAQVEKAAAAPVVIK